MKKKLSIALLITLSQAALALDFDQEWSKFESDFKSLKTLASTEAKSGNTVSMSSIEERSVYSKELLGYKLSNKQMRNSVIELYKKPNTVIFSLTIPE